MAIYRRYIVQQKYVDGKPTEEYRLGFEKDGINYHSQEACESGSECTKIEERWLEIHGDYICEDNIKYSKEKKQQKCITETEWVDVYPYEYRKGKIIETESSDCIVPEQYPLFMQTDGHGTIEVNPSLSMYNYSTELAFKANPNTGYIFSQYLYGSTSEFGSTYSDPLFRLHMPSHPLYISASFFEIPSGQLYLRDINGVEAFIPITSTTLDYTSIKWSGSDPIVIYEYGSIINSLIGFSSTSIRRVSFPGITSVGRETFYDCQLLYDAYLPNATRVSTSAFYLCTHLRSIEEHMPNLSVIGINAFYECHSPQFGNLNLPNLSIISASAFYGCEYIKNVNLPKLISLGVGAFEGCDEITNVSLPILRLLRRDNFKYCYNLESVYIPEVSIVTQAFVYCSKLNNIDLPKVVYLNSYAFNECENLTDVTLGLNSVASISEHAFRECNSNLLIHVPESLCEDYKSTYACPHSQTLLYRGEVCTSELIDCGLYKTMRIHTYTDNNGTINVSPSKPSYHRLDNVMITAVPNEGYSFISYNYGSTYMLGSITSSNPFSYVMSNDLYLSAKFESIIEPLYYSIYTYTDGNGSIIVSPSKELYSDGDTVKITAYTSTPYRFDRFDYGSTIAFGNVGFLPVLSLSTYQNWYISAKFSRIADYSSHLYVSYYNGEEYNYNYTSSNISQEGIPNLKSAVIIIDNDKVVRSISTTIVNGFYKGGFIGNSYLKYVQFDGCSYIGQHVFKGCSNLMTAKFSEAITIDSYAFMGCSNLRDISIPNCQNIRLFAFGNCSNLSVIYIPKASYIDYYAFSGCTNLEIVT